MAGARHRGIVTCLLLGVAVAAALPAAAFELFGIHLWGAREPDDAVEVIDPLPYTVGWRIAGGDSGLQRQLETASSLWTDRETPASGTAGLIAKARGDYRRLLAALYAEGYYGPAISIRAAGQEVADASLDAAFAAPVPVVIDVAVGPRFRFGRAAIVNAPPAAAFERDEIDTPAAVGFVPGRTARSGHHQPGLGRHHRAMAPPVAGQGARGRPRGDRRPRHRPCSTSTLTIDPGREAVYGPTRVEGSKRVDPEFIAFMADLPEGAPFDPDDLRRRPRPAEPARGLPLAALRRGRGDRAGRQPADHRPRRGPPAAQHRRRRHLLDDRRHRRLGLLGAPQPVPPRRAAALLGERRRPRLDRPRRLQLRARRRLHQARGLDAGHQLRRRRLGVQPRIRDLPAEAASKPAPASPSSSAAG